MKIVHIYARNLEIFTNALESTGCRVNGSSNIAYLRKSIYNFNARDVMGLVVYREHLTKKLLKLIREFDELFVFSPLPIIVVCDDASNLVSSKILKVTNCPLFIVDSVDGTISDIDLRKIFTTLCVLSDTMYDMGELDRSVAGNIATVPVSNRECAPLLADDVLDELKILGGIEYAGAGNS